MGESYQFAFLAAAHFAAELTAIAALSAGDNNRRSTTYPPPALFRPLSRRLDPAELADCA